MSKSTISTFELFQMLPDAEAAQKYADTLLESSIDVRSVDVFEYIGSGEKVERTEWRAA